MGNVDHTRYRIYIDEVGNNDLQSSDDPNHRFLCLTGLIFELDYVKVTVTPLLEMFKREFFQHHPDEPIILHRKEIVRQKYPFHSLKDPKVRYMFDEELIKILRNLDFVVISVLIDKKEHLSRYSKWRYDPYHYCLEILLERFFYFLKDKNGVGDLLLESRGGKEDRRLKETFANLVKNGSQYILSQDLLSRLTSKEIKLKPKIANISGLQLADLIAYPSYRYIVEHYKLYEIKQYTFGDRIIDIVKEKYYKSRNGIIDGYGIKKLP